MADSEWHMVRATDGMGNAGKRFLSCPVCHKVFSLYTGMPTHLTYEVIEGQETICKGCELVIHITCSSKTTCCAKEMCQSCAGLCDTEKKCLHWICKQSTTSCQCPRCGIKL